MDWQRAIAEERAVLQRIVALLLALADLAELASDRSQAIRGFVLWILRRAEAMARDLVIGTPVPISCHAGYTPADAIRLAKDFRDLAHALDRQALAFAVGDGKRGCSEQALPGVRGALHVRGAMAVTKARALRASARQTIGLASLFGPLDTS